jgi:hypothetical protein
VKTLFLNPNGSDAVTAQLLDAIRRAGGLQEAWEVRKLAGAPEIIASANDNERATVLLQRSLPALAQEFERLVLMSSLDTGYELAAQVAPGRVFGFTRGVLALHHRRGTPLQAVTFGADMRGLYAELFAQEEGAVESHGVFDAGPHVVSGAGAQDQFGAIASLCDRLHARSPAPVFLVGAVMLPLADQLRAARRPWIIDPVADLLEFLRSG